MPRIKKTKATIIVDTREKTPWDFEGDDSFESVVYTKLDQGDYSLKGYEKIVSIERKANADELFINFTQNKDRFIAEAERLMNEVKYRFIVIEQTLHEILNSDTYFINKSKRNKFAPNMPVVVVINNLLEMMIKYRIHIIFAGTKAKNISKGILLKIKELSDKELI